MKIRFVFPGSYFDKKKPDDIFVAEFQSFQGLGIPVSTLDVDHFIESEVIPPPQTGETIVYRGWMLDRALYFLLLKKLAEFQSHSITDIATYLKLHHLPNWYPLLKDLTPETVVLAIDADLESELTRLGWGAFFVKDYVKSLKTSAGPIIYHPKEIRMLVSEMEKFRGQIEGGICIRRVENFAVNTERRYFVIFGEPFASDIEAVIPSVVKECAIRIESNFFSVDVVKRTDGADRIVEIGDGQVSDLVGWTVERFTSVWLAVIDQQMTLNKGVTCGLDDTA